MGLRCGLLRCLSSHPTTIGQHHDAPPRTDTTISDDSGNDRAMDALGDKRVSDMSDEDLRKKLKDMHRRAQKAEGKLQRIEEALSEANRYALMKTPSEDRYHMLGWMISHMPPVMHYTFRKPYVPKK